MNNPIDNTKRPSSLMQVLSYTAEKTLQLADANSVIGEKIVVDGITVIPITKVSVGFAGGGANINNVGKKKYQSPAGAGSKVTLTPLSFLVINGKNVRVISVDTKEPSAISDIISTVIDKFKSGKQ